MSNTLKAAMGLALLAMIAVVGYNAMDVEQPVDVNVGTAELAIHGYDPVAYFTVGAPTKGSSEFSHTHEGAVFHFASAENRDLFIGESEKYMPAYGGFCSYGVTQGQKFDIDPTAWEIVNGKLYLQLDPGTRTVWLEKLDENIVTADSIWPTIRSVRAEDL